MKYYHPRAYKTTYVHRVVDKNSPPIRRIPAYRVVVIDETQDMTMLYYELVMKLFRDMQQDPILMILGDIKQAIYNFRGADPRFLSQFPWPQQLTHLTLSTSYRLTKPIAHFVNTYLLAEQKIVSVKEGPAVEYYYGDSYTAHLKFADSIIRDIRMGELKPSQIFVLAYSMRGSFKSPQARLENYFVNHEIDCYLITEDTENKQPLDNNKIVFSTYHSSKGREREVVIIYGVDHYLYSKHDNSGVVGQSAVRRDDSSQTPADSRPPRPSQR